MSDVKINYITVVAAKYEEPPGTRHTAWGVSYPGQNQEGYGKKISTRYMIKVAGDNRWYRVYATCFSNCASVWITRGRQCLHLANEEEVQRMAEEWERKTERGSVGASETKEKK